MSGAFVTITIGKSRKSRVISALGNIWEVQDLVTGLHAIVIS